MTQLEKNSTLVFPESVRVSTRHTEHFFSMFLNINDTFKLMEQLANIAMRQLLDNEAFAADRSLPKPCKTLKNVSALKRCPFFQPCVSLGTMWSWLAALLNESRRNPARTCSTFNETSGMN